jgi:2-dehydropantoate 2-reductase
MDVCIFGAGAIGGYLAAQLMRAGHGQVSLVARGEHLAAIRESGLELRGEGETFTGRPAIATDSVGDLPPQDIVFVTLKAPSLPGAAQDIGRLLKPDGCAVMIGNGIPFWWNHGLPGRHGTLPLLDPDGALFEAIGAERLVGGVVYSSNEAAGPGIIQHTSGNRWIFGEPDGSESARVDAIVRMLGEAGLRTEASPDLRRDIWIKLLRNAPLNPICALTRLNTAALTANPELVALANTVLDEVVAIAAAGGWDIAAEAAKGRYKVTPGGSEKPMRPSMLQDVLGGRGMEVDALLGQPQRLAREAGLPTPAIDTLLTLLRGLDASRTG